MSYSCASQPQTRRRRFFSRLSGAELVRQSTSGVVFFFVVLVVVMMLLQSRMRACVNNLLALMLAHARSHIRSINRPSMCARSINKCAHNRITTVVRFARNGTRARAPRTDQLAQHEPIKRDARARE